MRAILLYIIFFSAVGVNAQTYDFGDIPIEHLEMEVYEKDSTASSVKLFSIGETDLDYRNYKFHLTVKKHVRIKILTDQGLNEGDISILFRNDDSNSPQEIRNIKAESYTLNEEGDVIKESVGRRDRFKEEVSKERSQIKFTIPGIKKGSIIEYTYEVYSNNPLDFPDWLFQDDVPVIWSEYTARVPEWFNYLTISRGFHRYHINEQNVYAGSVLIREEKTGLTTTYGNRPNPKTDYKLEFNGTEFHYVMKDLPAIKTEPYMKASMDYLSHIRYQLESIKFPNQMSDRYLGSWGSLVNNMIDDEDFGARLRVSNSLTEAVSKITSDAENNLDKMIGIYNHVSEVMQWNNEYGLWAFEDIDKVMENGTGNGTSINLILIQMLREAGIEAHPVILSTRSNGELIRLFPISSQFNHTIAYVEFDGIYYLLDAKNENRPYNLLPSEVLNGEGLLIYQNQELWVPIINRISNSTLSMINVNFSEEGFNGSLSSNNKGFYAFNKRNTLDLSDLEKSVEEEILNIPIGSSMKVDSVWISKDKLDEAFEFSANFSNQHQSSSNIIYFNPMLVGGITENPFKLDERTFPIDYNYEFSESIVLNITIPDGWVIDEKPTPVLFKLPENMGEFRRIIQSSGNQISMNYVYKIKKMRFQSSEYEALKEMYDMMVEMLSQNLVLKKSI